ncbi:MAG: histidine triad nucleotide-binding protein [Pirellula sp.]
MGEPSHSCFFKRYRLLRNVFLIVSSKIPVWLKGHYRYNGSICPPIKVPHMLQETVFSKIVRKEIPAKIVYEDEQCIAFHDVHAQAPVHVLVIPKRQIESLESASTEDAQLLGHLQIVLQQVARQLGVQQSGYRVVMNCGRDGGQSVSHIHYHLLAGRAMQWPPG